MSSVHNCRQSSDEAKKETTQSETEAGCGKAFVSNYLRSGALFLHAFEVGRQ